ncbi:MAG TPA: tail fiber domain-containing protein, partial [Thermoanaerobaculia bacterium]|nr:tail fiber domain-containing protein [Thermoanaerobaculia bacterium]
TPLQALHVVGAATPTLRLEQPVSPGPARTWDVGANNTQFFVSDVTNSSSQPFRIRAGAPTSSIDISATGKVGIGTASPATKLDVSGSDGSTKLVVRETSSTTTAREIAELRNNGDAVLIFTNTSGGITRYASGLFGSSYIIDNQSNGGVEFTFGSTGNLAIAGTLSQGSSRDIKTQFATLDPQAVLSKVTALPVSLWSYKTEGGVRHVGPMAEDFAAAFGLGEDDRHIAPLDIAGVSLVALQALKTEKDAEIVLLRHENAQLTERLAALEALVSEMGAKRQ